jgi:N-acyl homoserine lactone hydrolase
VFRRCRFPSCRRGRPAIASGLAFVVLVVASAGCEQARRVPRVEPTLHAWPRPYRGLPGLELHVFDTGTFSMPRGFLAQGGSWFERRDVPVPAYVIRHPDGGWIVFDTGFSKLVNEDPNRYIGFLASIVGGFAMGEGQDLPSQMRESGIEPADVTHVVLSHLHFDHAGSIEGFPDAEIVVSADERRQARSAGTDFSLFNAADTDDVSRWHEITFDPMQPYATFTSHVDLLGDGSLILLPTPGHSHGSIALLVMLEDGPVLLAADAAPVEESWRYAAMPLWAANRDLWWDSIWRIKRFLQLVPESLLLGGHDARGMGIANRPAIVPHLFSRAQ